MRCWGAVFGVAAGALLALAPAARANELEFAYDYYQPGQGFQIGLRSQDGTSLPLPAGVNTADDELHPALSLDGRFLVFTRMKLLPKLNGDIPVPAQRSLVWVDLPTGEIPSFPAGTGGAGPTFTPRGSGSDLAWGLAPDGSSAAEGNTRVGAFSSGSQLPSFGFPFYTTLSSAADVYFPQVATSRSAFTEPLVNNPSCNGQCSAGRDLRYISLATINAASGAVNSLTTRLAVSGLKSGGPGQPVTLQSVDLSGASHPAARVGDHYVAMDRDADIHTIDFPGDTNSTVAPAPISTADPERMPAWSPDGLRLGFVRTANGRRTLAIYDLTPGIQAITTTSDLGADVPTPQTQAFQSLWGGVALADQAAAPIIVCPRACVPPALSRILTPLLNLTPTISLSPTGQKVGIFVVRRTGGTHRVLGVREPRIKVIGRVPLGHTRKGRNHLHWNGRVHGKRLKPGKYLLTFRLLRHGNVTATSKSIPFRVRVKSRGRR
jgi:WD40-like Beta Propeller Repeat